MCLKAFTNPFSGLSRCQCCMISVEHGLDSLKAALSLYIWNVSKLFLHAVALSVWKATASAAWSAATESGHLSLRRSAEGGCSNGNKPLVTPTVVMFTLSNFTGSSRGPLFGLSLLYFSIFSQSSILQFSLGCLCPLSLSMIVSMKAHTYTHKHTHTLAPSLSLSTSLFSPNLVEVGLICAPGQLIWFPLLSCEQLPFLSDQNLFIECSASGSIILNVLPE